MNQTAPAASRQYPAYRSGSKTYRQPRQRDPRSGLFPGSHPQNSVDPVRRPGDANDQRAAIRFHYPQLAFPLRLSVDADGMCRILLGVGPALLPVEDVIGADMDKPAVLYAGKSPRASLAPRRSTASPLRDDPRNNPRSLGQPH